MSIGITLSPPSNTHFLFRDQQLHYSSYHSLNITFQFCHSSKTSSSIQVSRRVPNFPQGVGNSVDDPRRWSRTIGSIYDEDGEEEEEEEEEEDEDRSLDLLVKFVENMFKKISRRARKAVRSVLPVSISTKLVGFSVNGVLMLALLWVLKAFLEVVCTLGSVVFVSILLIRGIWSGISYLQESRIRSHHNEFDDEPQTWNGAQPAT